MSSSLFSEGYFASILQIKIQYSKLKFNTVFANQSSIHWEFHHCSTNTNKQRMELQMMIFNIIISILVSLFVKVLWHLFCIMWRKFKVRVGHIFSLFARIYISFPGKSSPPHPVSMVVGTTTTTERKQEVPEEVLEEVPKEVVGTVIKIV